jgi:DNA-binding MarR family transcriptional regulator
MATSPSGQSVVDALMALSRALVALTARTLNEVGADITLTQFRTLVVLASRGRQRAADLASELGVQPSTATRLCDRLVTRGLARRFPGEADRRVVWVMLTDAGKDLIGHAMSKRRELLTSLVASLPIDDAPRFAQAATSLAVAAGELPDPQWWQQWQRSASLDAAALQQV